MKSGTRRICLQQCEEIDAFFSFFYMHGAGLRLGTGGVEKANTSYLHPHQEPKMCNLLSLVESLKGNSANWSRKFARRLGSSEWGVSLLLRGGMPYLTTNFS